MDNRRINVRKLFASIGFLSLFITSSHSNSVEIDIKNVKRTIYSNRIKIQCSSDELSNISNNYLEPSYIYSYDKPIFLTSNNSNLVAIENDNRKQITNNNEIKIKFNNFEILMDSNNSLLTHYC